MDVDGRSVEKCCDHRIKNWKRHFTTHTLLKSRISGATTFNKNDMNVLLYTVVGNKLFNTRVPICYKLIRIALID